jgi:hypothetical protein
MNKECYHPRSENECSLSIYYNYLEYTRNDPPISQEVKRIMKPEFLERWKNYSQDRPGKKDMTGIPLENALRTVLKNKLSPYGVMVSERGKKFNIFEKETIIPDALAIKEGKPTSLFSVKSWIGQTQLRETFAYGYFSKIWHGQKNIRLYMITIQDLKQSIKAMSSICHPYIDGVFSLSDNPYFDVLIEELQKLYG